ncbi:DUF3237 domain-containing protein [Nesterenkonia sp. E16_7]|uniref:DUF3237 domain-containing protein n=1 Tax=unclassified Nesterenkonia TaxID=2629769 RepID=UPI001A91BEF1|nr:MULTISPECIES: DUF3237 domain-containing protein [unclassified Nesterenkonia]MBO0594960.1 DUF3237 domain-containing protein [Nesterenkonia sp. E16_10]MBO0598615.1 DUF3237 domain-containing protein [Nesterenkonia sp. E16_7]
MSENVPTVPELEFLCRFEILVGQPIEVGTTHAGGRRVIPILGGKATGPKLSGSILPGGADFQLLRSETVTDLDARYVIEADNGERIYVTNQALRSGSADDISSLVRGEHVPAERIYFRCSPRFEVAGRELAWLESTVVVGSGARNPGAVVIDLWALR